MSNSLVFNKPDYDSGLKCQLFGVEVKDMNKEELISFIGMLDNLNTHNQEKGA